MLVCKRARGQREVGVGGSRGRGGGGGGGRGRGQGVSGGNVYDLGFDYNY